MVGCMCLYDVMPTGMLHMIPAHTNAKRPGSIPIFEIMICVDQYCGGPLRCLIYRFSDNFHNHSIGTHFIYLMYMELVMGAALRK